MKFDESIAGHNSWDENREKLETIISLLEKNGLEAKPGSRIYRYSRILKALNNENKEDLPKGFTEKKFHQMSTEIHQLHYGIVELSKTSSFSKWSNKFKFLVSGKELPENDQDYKPRNYQFELYIAGLLKKSGLEPLCKEPDIQIDQDGKKFGIAIKRPNSFSKLDENLRKARKQITKTIIPGIIVIDVSRISNQENYVAFAASVSEVTDHLIKYLNVFFERNYYSMKNIINHEMVFGIALHASCLSNINGAFGHSSRITIRNLCPENSDYMNHLNYFAKALRRSIK